MKENNLEKNSGLKMYFAKDVAESFAELEQNKRNFQVAEIVDQVLVQEIANFENPIYVAELGGGAHADRYHQFFKKITQEPKGHLDWVDISPLMLELAKKYIDSDDYQDRKEVIDFVEGEICEYLGGLKDWQLDLAIMKYTFNHIENIESLFELLSVKIKVGGKFVSTIANLNAELKSFSSNARYLYNGQQFPDDEKRELKDGDSYVIKFFKVAGDKNSGYLENAEVVSYYHSAEKIKKLAETFGFKVFIGDWKDLIMAGDEDVGVKQDIFVLTRK